MIVIFYVRVVPGLILVAIALHEVYRDIFQPGQQGSLSKAVGKSIFRLTRRLPPLFNSAGPLAFFGVLGCWTASILCGFALVYWTMLPSAFHITVNSENSTQHLFITSIYFSLEILTTLGIGDIIPQNRPVRFAVAGEALIGVLLFTASISWFVLLYPALAHLRVVAKRAHVVCEAAKHRGSHAISGNSESLLSAFTSDIVQVSVNFVQYPLIYYFNPVPKDFPFPHALLLLSRFAEAGLKEGNHEGVRVAAEGLRAALADLAHLLAANFVHSDSDDTVSGFQAYATEHLLRPDSDCAGVTTQGG